MQEKTPEERVRWIEKTVAEYSASTANSMGLATGEPAWEAPKLAFARGNDPLFAWLKTDIGPFLWTPEEAFAQAFPGAPVPGTQLSVISWVLPQTAKTKADQLRQREVPAERWARSRFFGEAFNYQLRLHLAMQLCGAGCRAVAPETLPSFSARCRSERYGLAANWSERHVAWIAGLGTFGLSDGLITEFGKAVRFGSVVVEADLPATSRPYRGHRDWCLWYARGTCGDCIPRCPAAAIAASGHDKELCQRYISSVTVPYVNRHYGTGASPCGLCQVGIPCASGNPLAGEPS